FFQKHLNLPGENKDETVTPFSPEELMVTPTGQVSTSYPSETIFTLNRKINSLNNTSATYTASHLAMNAEISFNRNLTAFVYTGKFNHKNILAEKYFIEHDKKDYALPLYVLRNETSNNNKTIIWLHPNGKSVLLDEPLAEELMEAGFTI